MDTGPDQEADIESDQEAYIELSDLESDPEVGELLPAPRRTDRHQDNDPQFLPRLKEKEKAMLGLWMSVVYVPDMEEAWRKFQAEYNTEMYAWNLIQHVGFSMPPLHPTFTCYLERRSGPLVPKTRSSSVD